MAKRTRRSVGLTVVIALVAAGAVLVVAPRGASSAEPRVFSASGAASMSNCMPCHPQLGPTDRVDLVFDHGTHILVQCTACHVYPAHADGAHPTPAMESCFTCHGLQHGPTGELASAECETCHTERSDLRPASHVSDWKDKPHATASADDINACMLCHSAPADCDACHADLRLDIDPMPAAYLATVPDVPVQPEVVIDMDAPVVASQCAYCHPDIDDFDVEGLIFAHATHLERAYSCAACHQVFPHGPDETSYIPMRDCYRCHGLTHDGHGEVASGACEKCHTPTFDLVPSDHTVAYLSGEHKTPALEDAAHCTQCHQATDCVECHNGGVELASGELGGKVIPENHRTPEWMSDHGGLFLGQEGLCAVCHEPASCQTCHVTTMPHPPTWMADHAKLNGTMPKDCTVCHSDREFCQDCHHDSVRSVALVRENCVECHEEMKILPPTDVPVAGLAEHAVHFDVAETRGEPYYCDDCHIGFGSAGIHVVNPATGPHDMRICYECHGALDYENVLIAPYRGAELCLRCHSDLNI